MLKIKVLVKNPVCLPQVIDKGDCIDLMAAEDVFFKAPYANVLHKRKDGDATKSYRSVVFDFKIIPLGVAMQLPKGFEAVLMPRSSLFKKTGLLETNSVGLIDNSYCGNNDEWGFPALATKNVTIKEGTRICQFRIKLSQKATIWQKLKWLFSNSVKIVPVESLSKENRGGFGNGTQYLDNQSND